MKDSQKFKPGYMIDGTYVVKQLLGAGGMGSVYHAEHHILRKEYAVKVLAPDQVTEENWQRFSLEGRAIARLDHPAIVKVHNMGIDDNTSPFYVMDLLRGNPLSHYCRPERRLSLDQILSIFLQVASGLNYAHKKGIIHRDIKPSNIMILQDKGDLQARIVDFGIAKFAYESSLNRISQAQTKTGLIFGSPLYMSPEQSLGETCDQRSDIYSLACTIFETLTGTPPFKGTTAIETITMHQTAAVPRLSDRAPEMDYPESLDYLLSKMLEKDRKKRYQSMNHVVHDLERIAQGKEIGKGAVKPYHEDQGAFSFLAWSKSNSKFGYFLAATILVVGSIVGGGAYLSMNKLYNRPEDKENVEAVKHFKNVETGMSNINSYRNLVPTIDAEPEYRLHSDDQKQVEQLLNCGPIRSRYFTQSGRRMRAIKFPPVEIASLTSYFLTEYTNVPARGEVVFPDSNNLRLDVEAEKQPVAVFHPDIYKRIDPNDVTVLRLRSITGGHLYWLSAAEGRQQKPCFVKIMETASKWNKLNQLDLDGIELSKPEDIASLDAFKSVERLTVVKAPNFPCEAARSKNIFKHIVFFRFVNCNAPNALLAEMSKYNRLQEAWLDGASVDPETIKNVALCKSLHKLTIESGNLSDKIIDATAQLTAISDLTIMNMTLSYEQIKALQNKFTKGTIHLKSEDFSGQEVAKLRSTRVVFE